MKLNNPTAGVSRNRHSFIPYHTGVVNINLQGAATQTIQLAGDLELAATNAPGDVTLRLIGDSVDRELWFPNWVFLGSFAPTGLMAEKTAVLALSAFGPDETDIVAAYSVEQ